METAYKNVKALGFWARWFKSEEWCVGMRSLRKAVDEASGMVEHGKWDNEHDKIVVWCYENSCTQQYLNWGGDAWRKYLKG